MWNVASGTLVATFECQTAVRSVTFSPVGNLFAAGLADGTVGIWGATPDSSNKSSGNHVSWNRTATLPPTGDVNTIAFSPDGLRLATGSRDGSVRLWDVASRSPLSTLGSHTNQVRTVAFSPDGKWLASGSMDRTIRIWDAIMAEGPHSERATTAILTAHTSWVNSLTFTRNGKWLISGSSDRTIRIWDTSTWSSLATFWSISEVTCLACSPDSTRLASGTLDAKMQVWDIASRTSVLILEGHAHWITSIAFSPDGTRLASGSFDDTIRISQSGPSNVSPLKVSDLVLPIPPFCSC
jgi:WD40 repeat protein